MSIKYKPESTWSEEDYVQYELIAAANEFVYNIVLYTILSSQYRETSGTEMIRGWYSEIEYISSISQYGQKVKTVLGELVPQLVNKYSSARMLPTQRGVVDEILAAISD